MSLADNAGHEVGVHGADFSAIDVGDLEERVGAAPCAAFAVDDLTDPPATFMRLHQHCVAYADLQDCLLYTSQSPRDYAASRMPSSA